jgi:hypothetical protein
MGRQWGVPLILLQNFRQGMDNIDPLLLDWFAQDRPLILFNNAGVASSSGETPNTIEAMADHVAGFLGALELRAVGRSSTSTQPRRRRHGISCCQRSRARMS